MLAAYIGMCISVVVWGSNFVAGDWLVHQLNPVLVAATRLIFSSSFLVISGLIMHRFAKLSKRHFLILLASGVVGTLLNQTCFFSAVRYISPAQSALIMSLSPVVTSLFSFLILKEKIALKTAVGAMVAIFGVFLLVMRGTHIHLNVGDAFSAGAMLTFSLNMVLVRKLSKELNYFTITIFSTVMGTTLFVPTATATQGLPMYSHALIFWTVLILSAVLSQGLCQIWMNNAVAKLGATQVAVVTNLQPFIAMIVGYFALNIPVTKIQIVGGLIIIAGIVLATVKLQRKRPRKQNIAIPM